MDGYYDYAPRKIPAVPICLIGFMGAGTHQLASLVSQMTGLPLFDIDRHIEHMAGRSLAHSYLEAGEFWVRDQEKAILSKALQSVPPGIIALGDGILLDPVNQDEVNSESILVYIERSLESLLAGIRAELLKRPAKYPQLIMMPPDDLESIRRLLDLRLPGYCRADFVIRGDNRKLSSLAGEIIRTVNL